MEQDYPETKLEVTRLKGKICFCLYIHTLKFILATIIVMYIHIVSDCIRDAQQSEIKMVHIIK